jgi:hypothetical protein
MLPDARPQKPDLFQSFPRCAPAGIEDPELRREFNKSESRDSLARGVFIHRLGEICDRIYEISSIAPRA